MGVPRPVHRSGPPSAPIAINEMQVRAIVWAISSVTVFKPRLTASTTSPKSGTGNVVGGLPSVVVADDGSSARQNLEHTSAVAREMATLVRRNRTATPMPTTAGVARSRTKLNVPYPTIPSSPLGSVSVVGLLPTYEYWLKPMAPPALGRIGSVDRKMPVDGSRTRARRSRSPSDPVSSPVNPNGETTPVAVRLPNGSKVALPTAAPDESVIVRTDPRASPSG